MCIKKLRTAPIRGATGARGPLSPRRFPVDGDAGPRARRIPGRAGSVDKRNSPRASPTRSNGTMMKDHTGKANNASNKKYATKVKKLVAFQGGRLESLLLPMLVTTSTLVQPKKTSVDEKMPEQCGPLGFVKKESLGFEDQFDQEGFDDVPDIIKKKAGIPNNEGEDYHEFHGSEDDEDQGTGADPGGKGGPKLTLANPNAGKLNQGKQQIYEGERKGQNSFIATLLHTLDCKSCGDVSCNKMRLVLGHFLSCQKLPSAQSCTLCSQLLAIVGQHAQTCCKKSDQACPVPMCDRIREELNQSSDGIAEKNDGDQEEKLRVFG